MLMPILLTACVLVAQAQTPPETLGPEVRRLVRQLYAPHLAQRQDAEEKLLGLGPDVLELLPPVGEQAPAEVQQRIGRVRQKLQQAAAVSAARPSLITLKADAMPLSEAIAALQQQSGNKIVDFRPQFGQEVPKVEQPLTLDFRDTPFWEALDRVLDEAGLTVYGFGEPQAVSLVQRVEGQVTRTAGAVYSGPFRFEPVRVVAQRDLLRPQSDSLLLALSVSWEPRLRPISLRQKMEDLKATDENGNPLAIAGRQAEIEVPAGEGSAVEIGVPLTLPPRSVAQIASLKGKLAALLPGKIETFRFDHLVEARNGELAGARNVEQRIAGVTVTLDQVRKNNELWEICVRVRFDQAGQALESHRGWIFNNEAYLEDAQGKPIPYDSLETTMQAENEVGVTYLFVLERPPTDCAFVYKTPGAIMAAQFEYEIRGVKLP